MERMVRTFEVTSSPMAPSPRVRPRSEAGSAGLIWTVVWAVVEGEGEAVELELAGVGGGFGGGQRGADAGVPGAEVVFGL